jgi:hypothetical protein
MDMLSDDQVRATAVSFATALDRNDFDAARRLLASDCQYDLRAASLTNEGTLVGPDAIITSYRGHDDRARRLFDRVEYWSAVESVDGTTATIVFGDTLEKNGQRHTYRCRQQIRLNGFGTIASIVHEDIPGEAAAVRLFLQRVGVDL